MRRIETRRRPRGHVFEAMPATGLCLLLGPVAAACATAPTPHVATGANAPDAEVPASAGEGPPGASLTQVAFAPEVCAGWSEVVIALADYGARCMTLRDLILEVDSCEDDQGPRCDEARSHEKLTLSQLYAAGRDVRHRSDAWRQACEAAMGEPAMGEFYLMTDVSPYADAMWRVEEVSGELEIYGIGEDEPSCAPWQMPPSTL